MKRSRPRAWLGPLGLAVLLASGCAVKRIENGVYHSSKGYRVTIPNGEWSPLHESAADLALGHRGAAARMAVNGVCEGPAPRRSPAVLARQLVIGLREVTVVERGTAEVGGRSGARMVLDGRLENAATLVRVESVSMKDGRCLYDFLYVAPPDVFGATRDDFARFVASFGTE